VGSHQSISTRQERATRRVSQHALLRIRAESGRSCGYLLCNSVVAFVDRTALLWLRLGFLIPCHVAGWSGFLWKGVVRTAFGNHVVYAENSATSLSILRCLLAILRRCGSA
jgi:hypothetical protein